MISLWLGPINWGNHYQYIHTHINRITCSIIQTIIRRLFASYLSKQNTHLSIGEDSFIPIRDDDYSSHQSFIHNVGHLLGGVNSALIVIETCTVVHANCYQLDPYPVLCSLLALLIDDFMSEWTAKKCKGIFSELEQKYMHI